MKRATAGWLLVVLLSFSALSDPPLEAREAYWEEHGVVLSGLSDEQIGVLESTMQQLISLEAGPLKINKGAYRRLSRFNHLFGSPFSGKALSQWLLLRIRKISYHNTWTVAVNQNRGTFILGDIFFKKIGPLERLYLLIHEARHSDEGGYDHVNCPKGFRFVSAAQPELDLEEEPSCDNRRDGAYAFQAAFLFELYAYGLIDQKEAGLFYNSSVSRLPP